jgi:hypothetical protein
MITKVDRFTATDASYVVPAGVTYMVAHIRAGGGGIGTSVGSASAGGDSSVAFAGGTVTATGGARYFSVQRVPGLTTVVYSTQAGAANSGKGAGISQIDDAAGTGYGSGMAGDGAEIVAGGAVTAGATLAITVGAGGTAGTNGAAGGSGYVYLEYQVKA